MYVSKIFEFEWSETKKQVNGQKQYKNYILGAVKIPNKQKDDIEEWN